MFLNMFTTNSGEAFELLDKLAPAVVGVFLLYLPALALAVYSIRRTETLTPLFQKRVFMLAMLMIGSGILVYTPAHRKYPHTAKLDNLYPINAFNNARFAVDSWEAAKNYPRTSRKFDYRATSARDTELPEIYIFVIGETSRARNWGPPGSARPPPPPLAAPPAAPNSTPCPMSFISTMYCHKSLRLIKAFR